MPPRTDRATPTHGAGAARDPATAQAGSRNPGCASSEPGRADAPVPRDEGATSCPQFRYAISPEGLYESSLRCFKGTDWKRSVAAFELNAWERCLRLSDELVSGTYEARPPKRFTITRPKRRPCLSVGIRDRVYQRSLCDNVVYPAMTGSLIPANCACQAGKGTDYARARLVKMLKRHWHHHGTAGYVLQMDVAGYYPNMRHDRVLELFARRLDPDSYGHVEAILSRQYAGDVGFEPGSQLVQIAGIAALDGLDHMVKERLHVKAYIRYMDDMLCLGETREGLERVRDAAAAWLEPMGLRLHPSKTRIQRIDRRIPWLGFTFELKPTGFVCVRAKPAKMRDARRRLKRVADAVRRGSMTPEKADEIAGTMTRYLRHNCSGRGQPAKMEEYWKTLRKEGAWNTGARPISA